MMIRGAELAESAKRSREISEVGKVTWCGPIARKNEAALRRAVKDQLMQWTMGRLLTFLNEDQKKPKKILLHV
jgi:hypothetical protein